MLIERNICRDLDRAKECMKHAAKYESTGQWHEAGCAVASARDTCEAIIVRVECLLDMLHARQYYSEQSHGLCVSVQRVRILRDMMVARLEDIEATIRAAGSGGQLGGQRPIKRPHI